MSPPTIYTGQESGCGPVPVKIGKHLRWNRATGIRWIMEHEQERRDRELGA